jgi:hypothetical protein
VEYLATAIVMITVGSLLTGTACLALSGTVRAVALITHRVGIQRATAVAGSTVMRPVRVRAVSLPDAE